MSQIAPQAPVALVPASANEDNFVHYIASAHCNEDDIVTLVQTTGQRSTIAPAGANPTTVAGIIQHDSDSVIAQNVTGKQGVFGQINGPISNQAAKCMVLTLQNTPIQINLTPTTGWITGGTQQAVVGTRVGLAVDPTTGFYLADPTASNKIATITEKIIGAGANNWNPATPLPTAFGPAFGKPGDTGARVVIVFDNTALNPTTGH